MENVITWNTANWVTILLMVAIGFTILGFVARYAQSQKKTAG